MSKVDVHNKGHIDRGTSLFVLIMTIDQFSKVKVRLIIGRDYSSRHVEIFKELTAQLNTLG